MAGKKKTARPPRKDTKAKFATGEMLAYIDNKKLYICEVLKDVSEKAESVSAKLLEETVANPLRFQTVRNGTVAVDAVLQPVAFTKEGNYVKITRKTRDALDKLVPPPSDTEEEESETEEDQEEEPRAPMTQVVRRAASASSSPIRAVKTALTQVPKKRSAPPKGNKKPAAKPRKGKPNPNIEVVEENPALEGRSNDIDVSCCSQCACRNLHRAAVTKNLKLLKACLTGENLLCSLIARWGPETKWTAFELVALSGNEKMLEILIEGFKNEKLKLAPLPPCGIEAVNTGQVGIEAFGVRVRAVKMSRGGREGNNAFMYPLSKLDSERSGIQSITQYLRKVVKRPTNHTVKVLEKIFLSISEAEPHLMNCIGDAVRAANRPAALWLVRLAVKKNGYGFNKLHEEVLGDGKLGEFKKVSVTKKVIGNYCVAPLHCAAICEDSRHLEQLLPMVDDIHYPDAQGRKTVHYAAACKSANCLKRVLAAGAKAADVDFQKTTPLMVAAKYNSAECCELLLKSGAPIDAKNKKKKSAIHIAAKYGSEDAMKVLIAYKSPKTLDMPGVNSITPLMYSASCGHLAVLQLLIANGAKVLKRDKMKRSALTLAVRNGHLPAVSFLMAQGADPEDPDSSKNFPLHYACAYGWPLCIDFLVANGANVNCTNDWKLPPLLISLLKGHFGCMRKMLEYPDVDVNCKDESGRTLLSRAMDVLTPQAVSEIEFLLRVKRADPNLGDLAGKTPLHHLCSKPKPVYPHSWDDPEEVKQTWVESAWELQVKTLHVLLENGANINALANSEETPLSFSIRAGNVRVCRELLKLNAEVTQISKNNTGVLHAVAALGGDMHEVAEELLSRREVLQACLNRVSDAGFTPLLQFMDAYAKQAQTVYQQIVTDVQHEEEKRLRAELNLPQQLPGGTTTSLTELTSAALLKGGARTRMTARCVQKWLPGQMQAPLALNDTKVTEIAKERFTDLVRKFMKVVALMIAKGEQTNAAVAKLKKYRDDPELIMKEWEEQQKAVNFDKTQSDRFFMTDMEGTKIWNEYGPEGKSTCLHLAAAYPHIEVVNFLLERTQVDVNARDFQGSTALAVFVRNQAEKEFITKILNKEDANPNLFDNDGKTALLLAAGLKQTEIVRELLQHHAMSETLTKSGDFPLKTSVALKDADTLRTLLDCGADPNFADHKKRTALHYAFNHADVSANASFATETLLLEAGADINAMDIRNRTPLHYAFVKIGHPDDCKTIDPIETVSSALGQKKVQTCVADSWGRTPLHYAAQRGSVTSALLLLSAGSDLDSVDQQGNTPLAVAVKSRHSDFAILLIQKGASVHSIVHIIKPKEKKKKQADPTNTYEIMVNDYSYNIYGQRNPAFTEQSSAGLPYGSFSLFRCAVKNQWQGVAYLLLSSGYDYMLALQDAMVEGYFTLVLTLLSKVSDDSVVRRCNDRRQNLFHVLALHGAEADQKLTNEIGAKLYMRKVDCKAADCDGCTPLHYACRTHFVHLVSYLRNINVNVECGDAQGRTPLVYAVEGRNVVTALPTLTAMEGADLNVKFQCDGVVTTPLIHAVDNDCHRELLTYLLDHRASTTDCDSQGRTVLMHAICRNNQSLVERIVNSVPLHVCDEKGRNAVHYVVRPFKIGSYENKAILELLAKLKADLNKKDRKSRTPMHYALRQKSMFMADTLTRLGAKAVSAEQRKTSNYTALAPADYVEDADTYIKLQQAVEMKIESPPMPDPVGGFKEYYRVVPDFDLLMCRVDVSHGPYSAYLFYRMQLLEDTNRGVFVVFTRWGRIGEDGANQRTPFSDKAEAVKEFSKIYKQKTGNEWGQPFQHIQGKYRLMELKRKRIEFKNFVRGLEEQKDRETKAPKEIAEAMRLMADLRIYSFVFSSGNIDEKVLNFSNISLQFLSEAESLLKDLGRLIPVLTTSKDTETILATKDQISSLSSRFYEIIPMTSYQHSMVPPIQRPQELKAALDLIDNLRNVELASQIVLGALYRRAELHPYDYCYLSLRCEMLPLPPDSDEYRMVETYARSGNCTNKIEAVFAIAREDEGLKHSAWASERHRMLLWHGSSIFNFFGILRHGLKIAPPEAPATGYMFGKGLYFADSFSKSFQYTGGVTDHAFMLLCEVVLGKMLLKYNGEYIEKLPDGHLSTKGCGQTGPDFTKSIVLNTGAIVPLGPQVQYPPPDNEQKAFYLHQNEYIVYDTSQVRLRYLIQLKTQNHLEF